MSDHLSKNDVLAVLKDIPESERKAHRKHTVLNKVWGSSEHANGKRVRKGSLTIQRGPGSDDKSHAIEFVLTQTLQKGDADYALAINDTTLAQTATFEGSETSTAGSVKIVVPGAVTTLEIHPDGTYGVQGAVCATADDAAASILALPENQDALSVELLCAVDEVFTDVSSGAAIASKGAPIAAAIAVIMIIKLVQNKPRPRHR
jgi:hypothetical protein